MDQRLASKLLNGPVSNIARDLCQTIFCMFSSMRLHGEIKKEKKRLRKRFKAKLNLVETSFSGYIR